METRSGGSNDNKNMWNESSFMRKRLPALDHNHDGKRYIGKRHA
jgi:hypothetical protein